MKPHKFRPSKRYVFACKENQKKLLKLSETMNGPELAKVFGCTKDAIYQALNRIKKDEEKDDDENDNFEGFKTCPIKKGAEICQELGYKHNAHYIRQNGIESFKQNIKPLIKKALA